MAAKAPRSARPASLAETLAARLADSLLPGDIAFEADKRAEAAEFVLAAAEKREPVTPVIALGSAAEGRRFMRIALINDDMPFLVDSVSGTVASDGLAIDRLVQQQAIMLATDKMFMITIVIFCLAAASIWIAPRPTRAPGMGGGDH